MVSNRKNKPLFLGVSEAAVELRVSGQTIRNWVRAERLPAIAVGAHGYLAIPLDAIHALKSERAAK
jgi:excisionase family DNA binding protein